MPLKLPTDLSKVIKSVTRLTLIQHQLDQKLKINKTQKIKLKYLVKIINVQKYMYIYYNNNIFVIIYDIIYML